MRKGKTSPEATVAMYEIYNALHTYIPTSTQDIFFQQVLAHYNEALLARDTRLDAVESILPQAFFAIVGFNLLLLILGMCFAEEKNPKPEMIVIAIVTIMVSINFALILIMDYPFSGDVAIRSTPFTQDVLGELYQAARINAP